MQNPISLKSAERKTFSLTFEDGLWDILLGLFIMEFALAPLLTASLGDFWSSFIFLPIWALAAAIIILIKHHMVTPRMGIVRLRLTRQVRLFRLNIAFLIAMIFLFVTGTLALMEMNASVELRTIFMAVMALIIFSIGARVLQQNRLFLYGCIVALAPILGEWLWLNLGLVHHGYPLTFGIASLTIIITGITKFILFLKRFTIPMEGME
jgi:hypothetical protein